MYEIGKLYKFELPNRIFYTGTVLEEDNISIKVFTKMEEKIVLNKNSIVQSKEIKDSIGDKNVSR